MINAQTRTAGRTRQYELEAGVLTLTTDATDQQDIFRIAERINPKRAFLFISTLLGRHIPVDPLEHRAALHKLAEGVSAQLLDGPVFVMGFAETAVGIGAGVFDCLRLTSPAKDIGYLTTTRFPASDARIWFTIQETHSHAVDHVILEPRTGVVQQGHDATLVLVDDETTTGKTFAELASALRASSLRFGRVVLVTLTDWSGGRAKASVSGIFDGADVHSISLQSGSWAWEAKRGHIPAALPDRCEAFRPPWTPKAQQTFAAPRLGLSSLESRQSGEAILALLQANGLRNACADEKILVVGAGEHVWQPMLVAEALCDRGIHARFITTTRSPIVRGETIRQKATFPDHYGQGFYMYMHNVVPSQWQRILFFTETGIDGLPDVLVRWLGRVEVIDWAGSVTLLETSQPV
ncbi:MAG: phosphoribosyltransferase domain-containing protein [Granulosicoccus sp.]